jgi:hypothetical protein
MVLTTIVVEVNNTTEVAAGDPEDRPATFSGL